MLRQSMTGFASQQGTVSEHAPDRPAMTWQWEMRGVNAKGLDLRLRLPDWIDGLEALIRKAVSARIARGNIQISLRVQGEAPQQNLRVDQNHMTAILTVMTEVENAALDLGLSLQPSSAADIVAMRGVMTSETPEQDISELKSALFADFEMALDTFCISRQREGAALLVIMNDQLDQIAGFVENANTLAAERAPIQKARLKSQLQQVLEGVSDFDETRISQELALIVVKSDITEELDRLRAHVDAARDLLGSEGAIGRKLDFLMQEFNREANTLCSKSQNSALTQVGLSLKTVIDQMREQVQNVE